MHNTRMHVLADADDEILTPSGPPSEALVSITNGGTRPAATTDAPSASNMSEMMQSETTHGRNHPSTSAHIEEGAVCNKQGTVTRMATVDLHAADSVEALRHTFDRIEDSLDARAEDDTAVAMEGKIMGQGEEGEQNRMAGGGAGQHTTQASKTLPIAGVMSSSGTVTWTRTPQGTPSGRSNRPGSQELQRYQAGCGRTNVDDLISTSGTPAATATQTTPQSAGCKKRTRDWT